MHVRLLAPAVVLAALSAAPFALARDADAAKAYVKEAQALIESKDFDDASAKLELAEAEAEDAPAGDKSAITASIAAAKAQIVSATAAADKPKYQRKLARVMEDGEGAIGNLAIWGGAEAAANELFADPAAKAALGDEITAAQKKFATFKKLHAKKAGAQMSADAETSVKELETTWADAKPKITADGDDKSSATRDTESAIESAQRMIKRLAAVDPDAAKPFAERVDVVGAEFTQLALAEQAAEMATRLKDSWDSYKDEYEGWEAETTGVSLADYASAGNEKNSALGAPKTVGLISRANDTLKNLADNEDYLKVASAPAVKAFVDKLTADRDTATAKMESFADAIIAEAEKKQPLDERTQRAVLQLDDGLKNNVEGSAKLPDLQARTQALLAGIKSGEHASAEAKAANEAEIAKFYEAAKAQAEKDWPAMQDAFKPEDGFAPNNPAAFKDKLILIETDNLMGYRFNTGDFPFATTIDGVPVAGKFNPAVAKAVKEIEAKLGRSLGDDDNDGKWTLIARVTGNTGKLSKRVDVSGEVRDTAGNTATVTDERAETVDAPIITIIAAHCGPLAVKGE